MTESAPSELEQPAPAVAKPSRALARWLNIAGVVIVGFLLWHESLQHDALWVWIVSGIALLGWLFRALFPLASPANLIALLLSIAASTAIVFPTNVLGFIPGLIGLMVLLANPRRPLALGLGVAFGVALALSVLAVVGNPPLGDLLGAGAGFVIATLAGVSRRQSRAGVDRERELLEQRARTATLAERSRITRDIHDVLAHSLGGLVLQLDAIDALLESGKTDDAHTRVIAARALAASGLDEARRAVDALRDPEASADLAGAIEDLVVTHRSLGAEATLSTRGTPVELSSDAAGALRRAAQEALSNARRHAPGQVTALKLNWLLDAVTLTASTPLAPGAPPSSPGGGRGLMGIRERVDGLGGTADWAVRDGVFVVTARIPLGASQ